MEPAPKAPQAPAMWIAGIDEAGYGPTLGPLVLSIASLAPATESSATESSAAESSAAESSAAESSAVLKSQHRPGDVRRWLAGAVCRKPTRTGRRVPIDDSKALFDPNRGIGTLEESVLACIAVATGAIPETLDHLLTTFSLVHPASFDAMPWYRERSLSLPRRADLRRVERFAATLRGRLRELGLRLALRTNPVSELSLNAAIDRTGNKASALFDELVCLLRDASPASRDRDVRVDRLGGRIYYAEPLEQAFPYAELRTLRESSACSAYELDGLFESMRIEFRMKGDRHDLLIALASMMSKYVRELFMEVFNRFWMEHVDDLQPTAGYPVDARRFLDSIRPGVRRLGLREDEFVRAR